MSVFFVLLCPKSGEHPQGGDRRRFYTLELIPARQIEQGRVHRPIRQGQEDLHQKGMFFGTEGRDRRRNGKDEEIPEDPVDGSIYVAFLLRKRLGGHSQPGDIPAGRAGAGVESGVAMRAAFRRLMGVDAADGTHQPLPDDLPAVGTDGRKRIAAAGGAGNGFLRYFRIAKRTDLHVFTSLSLLSGIITFSGYAVNPSSTGFA